MMPKKRSSQSKSDGYYHSVISLSLCVPAFLVGAHFSSVVGIDPGYSALLVMLGCMAGVIVSPDLDLPSLTYSEWVVLKLPFVGKPLGILYVWFWLPYSFLFKHRSFFTHGPIIGTAIRCGYACGIVWVIGRLMWDIETKPYIEYLMVYYPYYLCLFIGLCISDIGHYLRDVGIL